MAPLRTMLSLAVFSLFAAATNAAGLIARTDTCYAVSGSTCTNMYYGQKDSGTQVCISYSGGYVVVSYPKRDCKYKEGHVYIGESPPPTTAPGQYPYTTGNGYCSISSDSYTMTCKIPTSEFVCGKKYYIATHSADGCGETGWGYGPCQTSSCNPWAMYWGPFNYGCTCPTTSSSSSVCTSTSTYPGYATSSKCSTTGYSYSTSTICSTVTTTLTSYSTYKYTTTSNGYCTYTTTPAPSSYTTTCKAY